MDLFEHFKSISLEFAERTKISGLDFREREGFALSFDNIEVNVGIRAEKNELIAITFINSFSDLEAVEVYKKLLERNFLISSDVSGAFGVTPGENTITFSAKTELDSAKAEDLYKLISGSCKTASLWFNESVDDGSSEVDSSDSNMPFGAMKI
ncbi:type III secretion system chaperone [Pleionea sp. CnH1-48]|uniref:type III secretion system chaperone n=1 Tax=Pleionea sp. CnH1-48 TaxID=2954494 RepID=UPI0020973004|nr:type III secretion system chaperone [Pleionea sp. CnH1-48]MCO7223164.1 type III secretion system chaperone [Pleionea sp. CnH1-48]